MSYKHVWKQWNNANATVNKLYNSYDNKVQQLRVKKNVSAADIKVLVNRYKDWEGARHVAQSKMKDLINSNIQVGPFTGKPYQMSKRRQRSSPQSVLRSIYGRERQTRKK